MMHSTFPAKAFGFLFVCLFVWLGWFALFLFVCFFVVLFCFVLLWVFLFQRGGEKKCVPEVRLDMVCISDTDSNIDM